MIFRFGPYELVPESAHAERARAWVERVQRDAVSLSRSDRFED